MLNTLASYTEAGRKAGQASKEQDWPRAQSWIDWFKRAVQLETGQPNKTAAREAFETAYRKAASRTVKPF